MASTSKNSVLCLLLVISSFTIASSHDHTSMGHESHSSITESTVRDENLTDVHVPVQDDHAHHHHTGHHGMMDHDQHSHTATVRQQEDVTTEKDPATGGHGPHHHSSTGDHQHHHHLPSQPSSGDSSHHDHHGQGPKTEKEMDMMMDQASSVVDNRLTKKDEEKFKDYVEMVPDAHDGHDGHDGHGGHGGNDGHGGHGMGHGNSSDHDMGMMMYFRVGVDVIILFEQWHVKDVAGMIGSVIGIILLATFYEGLKYFREYLFKQYVSSMQFSTVAVTGESGRVTQVHKVQRHRILSFAHLIQTCLHVIQMVISYFLMLIFMTYNVWLCLAVIIGAGIGYFVFGWKKATVVDITEHCH